MTAREDTHRLHARALRLEWITTAWNIVEAFIAIGAGVAAGSIALIAFGADSLIEVTASAALLWRLLRAGPQATAEETELADRRALVVVGATFFVLAAYIGIDASAALMSREAPDTSVVGILLSVASLLVMPSLAYVKMTTARRMGSRALAAEAMETWVCAYLSAALLAGLGLHQFLGWWWADSAGALAMVPFIIWQGVRSFREARPESDDEHD
ncbi:MAG TPA: cation transporter [Anaerolineales bacterium]|nr:cation transporter [Anaerolineales bacterium]